MIKKSYPPGPRKKRRYSSGSEYKKELSEKQKLRSYYGLSESQFKSYVQESLKRRGKGGDATLNLLKEIEKRFDNVVFRLGFAKSRKEAKQLISHGYFLINSKPVNISSRKIKKGDIISFRDSKKNKNLFKSLKLTLKNHQAPEWLVLNREKAEGKAKEEPLGENVELPIDITAIFEFYSR